MIISKSFDYFRLIPIDLSKQTKSKGPQQINFVDKLGGQNNGATLEFLQNFVKIL